MNSDPLAAAARLLQTQELPSKNGDMFDTAVKYARLQGYLEGYLDQMAASKDAQEELVSKILAEITEIIGPMLKSR